MLQKTTLIIVMAGLLGLCLGGAAGITVGRARWHRPPAYDFQIGYDRRGLIIASQAEQTAPGQIAIIGDSIVERQRFGTLCRLDVLNAGISSAKVEDVERVALPSALKAKPARTILAVGINDFTHGEATPLPRLMAAYRRILDRLPPKPIVVGLGYAPGLSHKEIDAANRALQAETRRRSGRYVEPLPSSLLVDGVHPSLEGMRTWQRRAAAACD